MTVQPAPAMLVEIRYSSQECLDRWSSPQSDTSLPFHFAGLVETSPTGRCPSVPLLLRYAKVGFQLRDIPARRRSVGRDAPLVPEGSSNSCEDVCESI